ncbi:hypothetical protein OH76DRAFT_1350092 [Lentinus brumalis]|uniref:Transposase family Tnp2 protein n=1 Tax=Lentinus brumalis TaxID=2498619 RepID=A0A371DBE4_9APHY|nr:hypothetical protein OH76DRAFT_1350092 [Polyporus brumalis]
MPSSSAAGSTLDDPFDTFQASSPHWFWRVLLLMVSWLALKYSVPHRACNLILKVFRLILVGLGALKRDIDNSDEAPITIQTTFQRLGCHDDFDVHPVCPACHRVYPPHTPVTRTCDNCGVGLFKQEGLGFPLSVLLRRSKPAPQPILRCPINPVSSSLLRFLCQGSNMATCDLWRGEPPTPGTKTRLQDGKVWRTVPGPDGAAFFDNSPDRPNADELRIGILLGFDGFTYTNSSTASSHSSGVMSFAIGNLPNNLRYRARNLQIYGITPGPKEFTADELTFFMKSLVDDLIRLYDEGIVIKTKDYPQGRRVRVILVGVCCDHPAMCKVGGFADHSKAEGFCPRCHIKKSELRTDAAMTNGYEPRNGAEHKQRAHEYKEVDDPDEQEAFFDNFSVRYFELARLPYFDPVRMMVFNPMHNVLLGVVRTQWFDCWINTTPPVLRQRTEKLRVPRELDRIHEYLQSFEMPQWVARLPNQVGYPAGGSLTADEWKGLALIFCPIIIPLIWDEWYPSSVIDLQRKQETWRKKEAARIRRIAKGKAKDSDQSPAPEPQPRMLDGDDENFLRLAAALKILLGRSIHDEELPRARQLLYEYLTTFLKVRLESRCDSMTYDSNLPQLHPDKVKPNHHYLTHIFDQIEDYGPVYGFWTFVFERLNKLLKSYSTSKHSGGQVEVSFMRAFMRDASLRYIVGSFAVAPAFIRHANEMTCSCPVARHPYACYP